MLILDTPGRHVLMGDSMGDVGRWLSRTPRVWNQHSSLNEGYDYQWSLNVKYKEAEKMMTEGWHNGAMKLYEALNALPPPTTTHTKLTRDVAGHYPDVPRYLQGDPAHMVTRGKVHGKKPTISILLSANLSAHQAAEPMLHFGTALCAAVDKLESRGRRVELAVAYAAKHSRCNRTAIQGWKVKEPGEHLNLDEVAFSLAHPAAFRRIGFAMRERTPKMYDESGYGMPKSISEYEASLLGYEDALIVDCSGTKLSKCTNVLNATLFTINALNEAAGENIVEIDE